jgi:glycosyltransferase involved in cell wall biosynthesis
MKICHAFSRNGHKVTLVVPGKKQETEQGTEIFEYYGVDKLFDILYIPWLKIKGRGFIFGYLAARAAKRLKPDLVYCRSIIGCYFSVNKSPNVILEAHTPIDQNGIFSQYIFKKIIYHNNFQKLVVITKALKNYFEKFHPFLEDRIQVAPDGADPIPDNIEPVILPNAGKRMQVGYIGQLYKGKGMEVISRLAPLCPWADFHVVGGLKTDIEFWESVCKTDNLFFHGYVPHNVVGSYISAFDVLLLPNQEKVSTKSGCEIGSWTSPLKAFEYMSARKPILVSDLPVLREIFTDNSNALLAPPENIELWAENLKKICNDRECADRIANQAYNEFIEKYTWQVRASELVKIIE